jgi:HisA/HisF family protein
LQIIPVLDLRGGQAVLARRGERHLYRPLRTELCAQPEPRAVVEAYLALFPFRTIYIADLDAISGSAVNTALLRELIDANPGVKFWLDRGRLGQADPIPYTVTVAGTESGPSLTPGTADTTVLSLDFDGDTLRGDAAILENPQSWPRDVIVMCLRRIGSGQGPNLELLSRLRASAPGTRLYLGGGIRNVHDIEAIQALGTHGALVASALHDLTLDRAALEDILTA